jgi:hypothetical protein
MTSQRDETTSRVAGEEMTDDPVVIERHDEILADDSPADEILADDSPADEILADDSPADENPMAPGPVAPGPAGTSSTHADGTQPVAAGAPDPALPGGTIPGGTVPGGTVPRDRGPAAGDPGAGIPAAALSEQPWPAIQAMFVDDPRGSVLRAAAAADEVLKAFVASLEREQAALRFSWENGSDTTTEDLRTALQRYRAFCNRMESVAL